MRAVPPRGEALDSEAPDSEVPDSEAPDRVEIRVLGPVEIAGGQRSVPVGGPRLRALLAVLALRTPDVVSRQALVDGIWDGDPPANAVNTLRAHVAYLRRGLAGAGITDLVTTRPPGYALSAPAGCVDAHRFERLVAAARTATDPQDAAGRLDAALRLWRGEPLAGCPAGEWVRAEVTRLHEVRLCATEELFAAQLRLGRHASLVAELEATAARHPLRERLWELLMRALYLAGRQGEALQVYRRARALLVAEIGVEPGQRLRRLEAAILAGEPESGPGGSARPDGPGPLGPAGTDLPDGPAGAVPAPLTNLVGRRAEIAELGELLPRRRLVTLTGVGGCGKTRLALTVATGVAGRYADGVRFVDLTPLAGGALVAGTVAAALEVPANTSAGPLAALAEHLRARRCLLVLDNCEHLVRACADLVTSLLRSCPGLSVLATSREALGVPGEAAWPVPGLETPGEVAKRPGRPAPAGSAAPATSVALVTLAEIGRYDAVRLFLDRSAVAAVRGFGDEDAPAIAALCTRLDGLPLAIELAAARTPVLSVAEIVERLHDPRLLQAAGHPDRPHHRTLDATIEWSHGMLDAESRDRFRRLAVFAGGFTLDAAAAVWSDAAPDPASVGGSTAVDHLADLVGKSLVVTHRRPAGTRYGLLETIGRWAGTRLAACPATERDARRRHAEHYLAFAVEADRQLRGPELASWLPRLADEHENLRVALSWFAGEGDDPVARLCLAVALAGYCQLRGRYGEGREWLQGALAGPCAAAPPDTVAKALSATATFSLLMCDYDDARALAARALAGQRRIGDRQGAARTLRLLAAVARERGEYGRSLAALGESAAEPGAASDRDGGGGSAMAAVLQQTGYTAWLAGDLDCGERALRQAMRHYERLGDPENVASTRTHLAAVALHRGQLATAERMAADSLALFRELDVTEGVAWACDVVGLVALRRGDHGRAMASLRDSLVAHHALGDRWRQASVLDSLAAAVLAAGQPVRAAELAGLAAAIREAIGAPVPEQERAGWRRTRDALARLLPATERRAAGARGAAMGVAGVLAGLDGPSPCQEPPCQEPPCQEPAAPG